MSATDTSVPATRRNNLLQDIFISLPLFLIIDMQRCFHFELALFSCYLTGAVIVSLCVKYNSKLKSGAWFGAHCGLLAAG
jgi:hypothetical protein